MKKQDMIRAMVEYHNKMILTTQENLEFWRGICEHPNVTKEHRANTGNYDPSADCYWTEFKCPDCGKQWHVEGSV